MAKAKTEDTGMEAGSWEDLLAELAAKSSAGGSGDIYYLKRNRTRLRLVLPAGRNPRRFFAETVKVFREKESLAYLVPAVVIGTDVKDDQFVDPTKVRYVRVPKTLLPQIVSQLAEGWELFDLAKGHAITIDKAGSGSGENSRVTYSIRVSPNPVPLTLTAESWPAVDLDQAAVDEEKNQRDRAERLAGGTGAAKRPATDDDEELPF